MGGKEHSPSEQLPATRVSFDRGFWLGKYPVTQAQYRAVTGSSPSKHGGDDCPVENLSWEDAQAFLDALNKHEDTLSGEFRFPTRRNGSMLAELATLDIIASETTTQHLVIMPGSKKMGGMEGLIRSARRSLTRGAFTTCMVM